MSTSCRQATESAALRACVAKRRCCCVPVARVQQRPKWNVDRLSSADRAKRRPQACLQSGFVIPRTGVARNEDSAAIAAVSSVSYVNRRWRLPRKRRLLTLITDQPWLISE